MIAMVSKRRSSTKPIVALLPQASDLQNDMVRLPWRNNSSVASKVVMSLSDQEVRSLPQETRQQLLNSLKSGRITNSVRQAISKLLSTEIIEIEYQQLMVIKGAQDFVNITKSHLANLSKVPLGRKLLTSLSKSGKKVTIIFSNRVSEAPPDDFRNAIPKGAPLKWRDLWGKEKTVKGTGLGSGTTIRYNPKLMCNYRAAEWKNSPPEIMLAHELIHANDSAYGQLDPSEADGLRNYERQAVGLPPYENKEFTENKFRAAWSPPLSPRTKY